MALIAEVHYCELYERQEWLVTQHKNPLQKHLCNTMVTFPALHLDISRAFTTMALPPPAMFFRDFSPRDSCTRGTLQQLVAQPHHAPCRPPLSGLLYFPQANDDVMGATLGTAPGGRPCGRGGGRCVSQRPFLCPDYICLIRHPLMKYRKVLVLSVALELRRLIHNRLSHRLSQTIIMIDYHHMLDYPMID